MTKHEPTTWVARPERSDGRGEYSTTQPRSSQSVRPCRASEGGAPRIRVAVFVGVFASAIAFDVRADMSPPPFAKHAISSDGSVVVRVKEGKWSNSGKRTPKDQVSVYSYNAERDAYLLTSKSDLGELYPSEFLYVCDGGQYLVAVNIGHWLGGDTPGIRVYDGHGKLLKRWKLDEFLTQKELDSCPCTGSTTQWFEEGRLTKDSSSFNGPARSIKGWGSSATIIPGSEKETYSFQLDPPTLTMKKL